MNRKTHTSFATAFAFCCMNVACESPKNKSLPPTIADLKNSTPKSGANALWSELTTLLEIGNNRADNADALKTQLGTPSTLISNETKYEALSNKLAATYLSESYKTRCSKIDSITKIGESQRVSRSGSTTALEDLKRPGTTETLDNAASYYLLKFHLAADAAGTPEETPRYGYISIPNGNPSTSPLVAYAHGGVAGLSYFADVAALFGDLQVNHIVAAPAFPGEKICKGGFNANATSCDESGELVSDEHPANPFVADADVLLGMSDCVVRALAEAKSIQLGATPLSAQKFNPSIEDPSGIFGAKIGSVYKPHGTIDMSNMEGTKARALPLTFIVGSDLGGLTAELALAKTGAANGAFKGNAATNPQPLGAFYGSVASTFSCAAVVGAPSTIAHGENRLSLEHSTFAFLDKSPFKDLPFSRIFDAGVVSSYRAGQSTAANSAFEIQKRDALFNAALIAGGLMNWKSYLADRSSVPGAFLFVHGAKDLVVSPSQAALASGILDRVQAALKEKQKAAGVNVAALAVNPPAGTTVSATNQMYGHLSDVAFLDGTTLNTTDSANAEKVSPPFTTTASQKAPLDTTLDAAFQSYGSAPAIAIATWLSSSTGCGL